MGIKKLSNNLRYISNCLERRFPQQAGEIQEAARLCEDLSKKSSSYQDDFLDTHKHLINCLEKKSSFISTVFKYHPWEIYNIKTL